ncbi:MAG: UDP-N-acetylmuramate dehydrogenase [Patescibacteria group bacterium]|mgnify:CR=1 FL=1
MEIQSAVPLAPHTYFKIGGPARFFAVASSVGDVKEAVAFAMSHRVPFIVISGGSNVLIADDGYAGLVIKMNLRRMFTELHTITAGSGVPMAKVVSGAVAEGLTGIEWAIGIPGFVGGSVRGNAGCFGGDVARVLDSVFVLNSETGETETLPASVCEFGYRDSMFKRRPEFIILEATFRLNPGNKEESQKTVKAFTVERIAKQDIGAQCAGCMFKNPSPDMPAGKLIDEAGLKGYVIGGAQISQRHANYFLNAHHATAGDVAALATHAKAVVKEKFAIELEPEIQFIGFDKV